MTSHVPVMLNEMLQYLNPKVGELFLDCTFGAGGYSRAILSTCHCAVASIDQDPEVQLHAKIIKEEYPERFNFTLANFSQIEKQFIDTQFDGIVADLGVSSMQLASDERGFSFNHDGPLDMRMSKEGESAADFINSASESEITDVIYKYGDEHASRKIAKKIIEERKIAPIVNSGRLASIVRSVKGAKCGKIDQATKTFQAIRIHINNELQQIEIFLNSALRLLSPNGRLVVISFHSLEDSIVKDFIKNNAPKNIARSKYAKEFKEEDGKELQILTKKPISPQRQEIINNPRSRSAKLRAAVKTGGHAELMERTVQQAQNEDDGYKW